MQKRSKGKQLTLIGIGVIALVLIGGLLISHMGGSGSPPPSSVATQQVAAEATIVMASQTIPQGTVFKAGQNLSQFFTVRDIPPSLVPYSAYTSLAQIAALSQSPGCGPVRAPGCEGQITTTQTIYQNTPVVSGMFTSLGQYRLNAGPSFAIPFGYVGIAINFSAADSVLGAIQAGDTVDLMASYKGGNAGSVKSDGETQYVMSNMRVISVNAPPTLNGQPAAGSNASGGTASTATANTAQAQASAQDNAGSLVLLARYQQALVIQHLKDFGWQLSAVLRSAREPGIQHFKTIPVTDKWFFTKNPNPFETNPGY